MTLRILTGFDTAVIGSLQMIANTGAGDVTVTVPTGRYAHVDLTSVMGAGEYDDLAGALTTALNASALAGTWTVSYNSGSAGFYRVTCIGATGTIGGLGADHGTAAVARLGAAMGYSTSPGAFASGIAEVGDVTPYYAIHGTQGAYSNVSDDYEAGDLTEDGEAEDGTAYSVSRTTAATYFDFRVPFEPHAAVHTREASASAPWTWQHFFPHVRGEEPVAVVFDGTTSVHTLRASSTRFKPVREQADWDGSWSIDLDTRLLGRL